MKNTKLVLCSAEEVFCALWSEIKGEVETKKIDNLKIIFDEWSDAYESGSSGIVFNEYFVLKQQDLFICFLRGCGYSSGRGDKACGSVAYAIKVKCKNESELIKILRKKMSNTGWKFLEEALEIIKLSSANNLIFTQSYKNFSTGKYLVKDGIKYLYKKEIVKFIINIIIKNFCIGEKRLKKKNSKEIIFLKWPRY